MIAGKKLCTFYEILPAILYELYASHLCLFYEPFPTYSHFISKFLVVVNAWYKSSLV
jgi:hypothetical protein